MKVKTMYVSSERFVSEGKDTQLRENIREVGGKPADEAQTLKKPKLIPGTG